MKVVIKTIPIAIIYKYELPVLNGTECYITCGEIRDCTVTLDIKTNKPIVYINNVLGWKQEDGTELQAIRKHYRILAYWTGYSYELANKKYIGTANYDGLVYHYLLQDN